ncbi:uncharacterized protein LOC110269516 [Arachis ipaensis]|uniref:uncharacterized protein LOC110269516 n=1 Tax=Arachis ipaensis TaxID=130454 RepID=UPI000A2B40B5|nr:uncharacterized protein LOC110269516 [Arachis ipaensis]
MGHHWKIRLTQPEDAIAEIIGEKLKEKLKAVEVREDDPYHWVNEDVRTRSSSFTSVDSLSELRGVDFVRRGSEPSQILEASERSEEEEFLLDFLVESVAAGECMSIADILRFYDSGDVEGLKMYIGNILFAFHLYNCLYGFTDVGDYPVGGRVPLLNPLKLQTFLNKKKDKTVGPAEHKESGGQAFSSVGRPASSFKRKRDDISLEVLILSLIDRRNFMALLRGRILILFGVNSSTLLSFLIGLLNTRGICL